MNLNLFLLQRECLDVGPPHLTQFHFTWYKPRSSVAVVSMGGEALAGLAKKKKKSSRFLNIHNKTLGLLVPEAELFLGNIVREMVSFAAALDATLVGGALACCVPAAAVLQQTRVPLQPQGVRAETWLPQVFSSMTGLKAG